MQVSTLNNHKFTWFLFDTAATSKQPNSHFELLKKNEKKNSYLAAWGLVLLLVLWKFCFRTDNVEERDWDERIENKMNFGLSLNSLMHSSQ